MKNLKRIIGIGLVSCIIFSFIGCDATEKSSTGIYDMSIEDLSKETFYVDCVSDSFKMDVMSTKEYEASDVNVMILDDTIIDITFEKKDSLFSKYISFSITGLKEGTTSFYFETVDKVLQSESVEVSVVKNITSIKFSSTEDVLLYDWDTTESRGFSYESQKNILEPKNCFEFVSENTEVVTVEYDEDSWFGENCIITRVGAGETYIYIQTKDKSVQSEKIRVVVEAEKIEEEVAADTPTVETPTTETPVDNSRTVYITPYGKKYHYSQSCAGENASATTENSAKKTHDPCKKCAQ